MGMFTLLIKTADDTNIGSFKQIIDALSRQVNHITLQHTNLDHLLSDIEVVPEVAALYECDAELDASSNSSYDAKIFDLSNQLSKAKGDARHWQDRVKALEILYGTPESDKDMEGKIKIICQKGGPLLEMIRDIRALTGLSLVDAKHIAEKYRRML